MNQKEGNGGGSGEFDGISNAVEIVMRYRQTLEREMFLKKERVESKMSRYCVARG